jgi:hypothetical protein
MDDLDSLARKRANSKLRFYTHAGIFIVVNSALYFAGVYEIRTWHAWPFIGWSVGLAIHGYFALIYPPLRERMIARERRLLAKKEIGV